MHEWVVWVNQWGKWEEYTTYDNPHDAESLAQDLHDMNGYPVLVSERRAGKPANRKEEVKMETTAQTDGTQMARCLRGVFQTRANLNIAALMQLARIFAEWSGYRDLRQGQDFQMAFVAGMMGSDIAQLMAPLEEKDVK